MSLENKCGINYIIYEKHSHIFEFKDPVCCDQSGKPHEVHNYANKTTFKHRRIC
jgi:hypothetical protein